MISEQRERRGPAGPLQRIAGDPVMAVSAGLLGLCLLLGAAAVVSADARGFYEAGFAALYEAMAGMAAACQWNY